MFTLVRKILQAHSQTIEMHYSVSSSDIDITSISVRSFDAINEAINKFITDLRYNFPSYDIFREYQGDPNVLLAFTATLPKDVDEINSFEDIIKDSVGNLIHFISEIIKEDNFYSSLPAVMKVEYDNEGEIIDEH